MHDVPDRLTGDASASGHITPSFGGNTVADIGADVSAGGAPAAGMLFGGGTAADVGLGGKNGGRIGRPAAPDWKGGVPAAGGATAGDPANGGKAPGGGGMKPGGGAKGGILRRKELGHDTLKDVIRSSLPVRWHSRR